MTLPGDPPERDELDRRLEAGLRRLTEPSSEPTPSRIAIIASTRGASRTFPGAQFAILIVVLAVGAVLSLQVVPGIPAASSDPVAGQTVAPPVVSNGPAPATAPSTVNVTAWIDDAWPPIIEGPFGTLDATGYLDDAGTTLGYMPAVEGPFVERYGGGPAVTTYLALDGPQDLADRAQVVVRGRPLAFSRPYFNSTDGAFWLPELVGVKGGVLPTSDLRRDVLFQVEEVLGTTLEGGFEPGLIQFTVPAGQVVVDVPSDVPYAPGYGEHVLKAGRYLVSEEPAADLGVGQEVVLFLRYGEWLGLYDASYGVVRTLMSAHGLYYAFAIEGERTRNLSANPVGDRWQPTLSELRRIAGTLAPEAGQILPDARVHPARPTHDSSEQPLPSPTPCPPRLVGGIQPRYLSLAALLDDSDLVVVARSTTRAKSVSSPGDGPFVALANDILVEEVIRGDAAVGSLLPVLRLADSDPACPLVIVDVAPLEIDRPYLMALRRDGDRFVLPEAPQALAEVRGGVLSSTRWPELDGLTVQAARELLARRVPTEGPSSDDPVDVLVGDLRAAGASVTPLESFEAGLPFGVSGLKLCVAGQKVWVYAYASADEAARVAGTIDPTDPSHVGASIIVSWQGNPRFWQRDRLLVLYLGADRATEELLTDVLGQPFAAGAGRQTDPSADAC